MTSDAPDAPKQDQVNPIGVASNPANQTEASGQPMRAELHKTQPAQYARKAYNCEKRWIERGKLLLEAFTLGAVVFYGIVAYRQWCAMTAANQQNMTTFQTTERPWVGLANTEVLGYPSDTNIKVMVDFENGGRSPASQVWFRDFTITPLDSARYKQVAEECRGKPTDAGVGTLLLPGLHHHLTIYSDPLQPGTIEYIRERLGQRPKPSPSVDLHPEGIIFIGCIDYMWGDNCYRTRLCQQYKATPSPEGAFGIYGVFGYCNFSNDTAENPNCKRK
jgi:hypothetical protein